MIKQILFLLYKITDNSFFQPFHRLIQLLYVGPLIKFIGFILKSGNSDLVAVLPRHSTTERGNFNTFMSDLDSSWIIKDNFSAKKLRHSLKLFSIMKWFCPSLDEPEIYLQTEDKIISSFMADKHFMELNGFLKLLRKFKWEHDKLLSTKSNYERAKSIRSLKKIISKTNIPINNLTSPEVILNISNSKLIKFSNSPQPPPLFSYYLNIQINKKDNVYIVGKDDMIIFLILILPEIDFSVAHDFNLFVKKARCNPEIKQLYVKNLILELFLCQSSIRTLNHKQNVNIKIMKEFIHELKTNHMDILEDYPALANFSIYSNTKTINS